MKRIIKIFIVTAIAIICLTACQKDYYIYIVEGRLIDKTTREPIADIMVSFNKYDIIHPIEKTQKRSPIGGPERSNENGEFRTLETYSTSLLYIYGYSSLKNSLYKDTVILVDFSNVPLSGKPYKNEKGEYVLNVGNIELVKP